MHDDQRLRTEQPNQITVNRLAATLDFEIPRASFSNIYVRYTIFMFTINHTLIWMYIKFLDE